MAKAFFRSEKMELCQLLLHVENAFDCLVELGHQGKVQFNNVYDEDRILNGIYTKNVNRCNELMRIVNSLQSQMDQLKIESLYYPEVDVDYRPREATIKEYDERLHRVHLEATAVMENYQTLDRRKSQMMEQRFAIQKAEKFLVSDRGVGSELLYSESTINQLIRDTSEAEASSTHLNYMVGTIRASKFENFELMLYRLFGFNLMVRFAEFPHLVMDYHGHKSESVRKFALLMMTTSKEIRLKLIRVCQAFHVSIYFCPETSSKRMEFINELSKKILDLDRVLQQTRETRKSMLQLVALDLYIIRINLKKSRMIYNLLNRLNVVGGVEHHKYLQAECFVPASEVNEVREALRRGIRLTGGADRGLKRKENSENLSFPPILIKSKRKFKHVPPTYFRLNKFTRGFQNLIDAYGMADYQEINPAPFTIITFPFLFAVMFGDFGHGCIMTLFALMLMWKEQDIEKSRRNSQRENEILNILFEGRYIILLMGLFSMYIGMFIYNDALSKSFNIFGSSWSCRYNASTVGNIQGQLTFDSSSPNFYSGDPYPCGMDPVWDVCGEDSITTFNSVKMKMAIILGITQMIFGLSLAACNCWRLKRKVDLMLVVIPQFVFMLCLFCYLVFLIFFKWLTYGGHKAAPKNSGCAPSVLIIFIDMMLMKTSEMVDRDCERNMYPYERMVEYGLVFIAFLTIPILLAGKPIYLTRRQKQLNKKRKERSLSDLKQKGRDTLREMRSSLRYSLDDGLSGGRSSSTHKLNNVADAVEFDMSEIWIHSGIHTIESVLGSVSHTASYLRLWALSLAHDQLANVLWHMILSRGLKNRLPHYLGVPALALVFFIWAILTLAILVMMEGLSAFLHTLRLHWVEFQSKFFNGAGEAFAPFYFPRSTKRD